MTLRLVIAAIAILSVGRLRPIKDQASPWIIPGVATSQRPIWSPVSGSIQVDAGDKYWMRPNETNEQFHLRRDDVLREYIQKIQANARWDSRISLKVYRLSMVIVFVLNLEDSNEAKKILNELIGGVLKENSTQGGPRSYIGLRAIDPVRDGYY